MESVTPTNETGKNSAQGAMPRLGSPEDMAARRALHQNAQEVLRHDFEEIAYHVDRINEAVTELLISSANDELANEDRAALARIAEAAFMIRGFVPSDDDESEEPAEKSSDSDLARVVRQADGEKGSDSDAAHAARHADRALDRIGGHVREALEGVRTAHRFLMCTTVLGDSKGPAFDAVQNVYMANGELEEVERILGESSNG